MVCTLMDNKYALLLFPNILFLIVVLTKISFVIFDIVVKGKVCLRTKWPIRPELIPVSLT